jgi:hypothetical protein
MLKKPHFRIEKRPMRLLRFITNIFPYIFTLPQHISDGIEYILD